MYIRYRWIEKDRRRDKDNISFAKKFIQDALIDAQILPDDGWKWIEGFEDHFAVDRKNPRMCGEVARRTHKRQCNV